MSRTFLIGFIILFPITAFAEQVPLYRIGSAVTMGGEGDTHIIGKTVQMQDLDGDAMVLAHSLIVPGSIRGDLDAFAQELSIVGSIEDDAHMVSSSMNLQGSVGGHLLAAGGNISIASDAIIGDVSTVIGKKVDLRGHFERLVYVLGDEVTLAGTYDGDVIVLARSTLTVHPGTAIGGQLRYSVRPGATVRIPETLQNVQGKLVSSEEWARFFLRAPLPRVRFSPFLSLWLIGALFILLRPRTAKECKAIVRERPMLSFGLGITFFFAVCIAMLLAFLPFFMLTAILFLFLLLSGCIALSLAPLALASFRPFDHLQRFLGIRQKSFLIDYTVASALLSLFFLLLPSIAIILFFFLTLMSLGTLLRVFSIDGHSKFPA